MWISPCQCFMLNNIQHSITTSLESSLVEQCNELDFQNYARTKCMSGLVLNDLKCSCCLLYSVDKHVLTIRVTLRMYYKRHERLLFASALVHPRFVVGYALLIFLYFCIVLCFCVLFVFVLYLVCPMLPASLDCPSLIDLL